MTTRYVVMGKKVPRSVGFTSKASAEKYSKYHKEKGGTPKIYKRSESSLKSRFKERYAKKHKK